MLKWWTKISNIGITDNLSLFQKNQIILLNRIVTIFSVAIWSRLISDIIDKDWTGMIIIITMGTLFSSTFLFNYFKKFNLAKGYFISIFITVITLLNIMAGKELGAEFSYFSIAVMTIIFFKSSFWKTFYVGLIILCYLMCQFYFQNFESPLSYIINSSSYHFMFFANLLCTLLAAFTFVQDNNRFSQQTVKLLEEAEEQNTTLEKTQLTLEKQNKKLENANKELEKFAYIASHDLKTPLRNINNFLHLIHRKLKQSQDEELLEYISYASKSARQMHYLIEDILEYSRLNGENFSLKEVNLNEVLPKVKNNIKGFIEEKNAVVHFENLPTIQGNESQLSLIFQNLIENGIKYNKNETPTIQIFCETTDSNYILTIKDNGIGINDQYFDRIFEMFTRLHNQDEFQGSGIGLSICQKIVEYHGGTIQLKSILGQGTSFIISFPKTNAIPDFSLSAISAKDAAFDLN